MIPTPHSSPLDVALLDPVPRNYVPALHEESTTRRVPVSRGASLAARINDAMARERDLRGLCCRILGWSSERARLVDDAMHALHTAAARGGAVALQGDSDLVPVAFALHRRLLGPDRPFVVCDPRRRAGDGSVRVPPNRNTGMLALAAAAGGSICVHSNRLPSDFDALAMSLREHSTKVVLFVCLHNHDRMMDVLCRPITIPPLAARRPELERLLDECLDEAAQSLGVERPQLSERIQRCVLEDVESLCDLEKAALRLVVLRNTPNVNQAAQRLNMALVSLNRWIARRRWAVEFLHEPDDVIALSTSDGDASTDCFDAQPPDIDEPHGPAAAPAL